MVEAALMLPEKMCLFQEDLAAAPPGGADVRRVRVGVGGRRGSQSENAAGVWAYWKRIVEHWDERRLDEPTRRRPAADNHVKTCVVAAERQWWPQRAGAPGKGRQESGDKTLRTFSPGKPLRRSQPRGWGECLTGQYGAVIGAAAWASGASQGRLG
jgi:hypothetical protein